MAGRRVHSAVAAATVSLPQNGGTSYPASNSGWIGEISLDLDAVSALCPNCHILLVEAASSSLSDMSAADARAAAVGANQISDSWSGGSTNGIPGTHTFPGVATIVSSGDNGYVALSRRWARW